MGHYSNNIYFDRIELVVTPSGDKSHPEKLREIADAIENGDVENYNITLVNDHKSSLDRVTITNIYGGGNSLVNSKKHYGPITEIHIDSQTSTTEVFNRYSEAIDIDHAIDNDGTSLISIGPVLDKDFAELTKFDPRDLEL